MFGSVNGKMTVLMSSACIAGGLAFRDDSCNTNWDALSPSLVNRYSEIQAPGAMFNNVQANQLGPFTLTVAVPDNGNFTILTGGRERDLVDDDDPNPRGKRIYPRIIGIAHRNMIFLALAFPEIQL
jgi:hypothetical protein